MSRPCDVAEAVAQVAPAGGVRLRQPAPLLQPLDDPLPHLRGRFARERDREDVLRVDAGAQQVDVALDEHARLSGARGRLENDVFAGIDGERTRVGVRERTGRARVVGRLSSVFSRTDDWRLVTEDYRVIIEG